MVDDEQTFGDYIKQLIKEAGLTQCDFYTQLGITKPYFYDIIAKRVNPPPPQLQFKALEILRADEYTRDHFFDLAAKERGELPADIMQMIRDNPSVISNIRKQLKQISSYNTVIGGRRNG